MAKEQHQRTSSGKEHIIPIQIEQESSKYGEYPRSSTPRPPSPASTMIEIDSDLDETIRPSSRNDSREITHKISYSTPKHTPKNDSLSSKLSEGEKKKILKEEEKRLKKIKEDEKKLR